MPDDLIDYERAELLKALSAVVPDPQAERITQAIDALISAWLDAKKE